MHIADDFPRVLPILVEEEFVYPFGIIPIFTYDEKNIKAANKAAETNRLVLVCCSKTARDEEKREEGEFYDVGVVCEIVRKVSLPDGRTKILVQGVAIAKILEVQSNDTQEAIEVMTDIIRYEAYNVERVEAMIMFLRENVQNYANLSQFPPEMLKTLEETSEPNRLINLVASTLHLKKDVIYRLFASNKIEERMMKIIDLITQEIQVLKLQKEIKSRVHNKMDQVNREYFLKEQLRQIQKELGIDKQRDEEIDEFSKKLESIKDFLNKDAYKEIKKQINRLSKMHQESADANLLQNYVEWVLEIPFGTYAKGELSIKNVQKQLDIDHCSLIKPKERIIEYFAVRELLAKNKKHPKTTKQNTQSAAEKDDEQGARGTILCFYGPPGVGKTSLANSIAKAMGRQLVRIALGGLEDVNELRGHRRTYIGAMPGRIVQGLIDAKEMNPVMVLDEIDKVARGVRGDPTSVLLEILDPEQNIEFRDYYTNFSIDLSQVIFIATANDITSIPAPLRDRMEFIAISSYTPQEKEQIANKYLIPQELKKHGLTQKQLSFTKECIKTLIERYTREAGVRNLRRVLATIMRKVATQVLSNPKFNPIKLTSKQIPNFLDKIVFEIDPAQKISRIGVINGLAWTSVGGDVLKIEAIRLRGKGDLMLTGSLGDVMKESAQIAHSVVKVLIDNGTLDSDNAMLKSKKGKKEPALYDQYNIHLHLPEGATPKDGPSAGIAMACVIASILCQKPISGEIAMTGELTLTGDVLAIGGLKEKLIAAHKASIKRVLIPSKNFERDLAEIPKEVLNSIKIIPVKTINEVFKEVFQKHK